MINLTLSSSRFQLRQADGHRGAFPRHAVDLDGPLMGFDDALDDGQAQAAAFFLGGEKGVEDLFQGFLVDAVAAVLKTDFAAPAPGTRGN